ncbi:MAG: hypothetical protein Q4Q58_05490 [Thermoplasmata archaeon]|nr:hypothetical protein [Thermoplasmata archaeon]
MFSSVDDPPSLTTVTDAPAASSSDAMHSSLEAESHIPSSHPMSIISR